MNVGVIIFPCNIAERREPLFAVHEPHFFSPVVIQTLWRPRQRRRPRARCIEFTWRTQWRASLVSRHKILQQIHTRGDRLDGD